MSRQTYKFFLKNKVIVSSVSIDGKVRQVYDILVKCIIINCKYEVGNFYGDASYIIELKSFQWKNRTSFNFKYQFVFIITMFK